MNQWQPRRDDPNWHSNSPQGQFGPPQYQPQQQPYGYQQPQQYYPESHVQPPVQVNVQQNAGGPRRAVTQGKLGAFEELFHIMMIICTCGFWYPVYASRKRSKRSVTRYR